MSTEADATDLWTRMIAAAADALGTEWPKVRGYAEPELRRLARTLVDIGERTAEGDISKREARALLRIHRNTTQTVLLAAEGMSILAAEKAVNAALRAVRDTVAAAFGRIL
jgi:hypothetical protein